VAGADAGYGSIRKGLETALTVADNGLRKLEDAVRMFRVAMHHVSHVAVSCGKRNGGLVRVREHPKER
jgi:hypothetical protein